MGEIDLIAVDGDQVVFVEVKTRAHDGDIDPRSVVQPEKWKRVATTARHFLSRNPSISNGCRFDLVTIAWPIDGSPRVEHYENVYES